MRELYTTMRDYSMANRTLQKQKASSTTPPIYSKFELPSQSKPTSKDFTDAFNSKVGALCACLIEYAEGVVTYGKDKGTDIDSIPEDTEKCHVIQRNKINDFLNKNNFNRNLIPDINFNLHLKYYFPEVGKQVTAGLIFTHLNKAFIVLRGTAGDELLGESNVEMELVKPVDHTSGKNWLSNSGALVKYGYNRIYTSSFPFSTRNLCSYNFSLRNQIFDFIKSRPNIEKIIITGHSLGGSMCHFISADLAQNMPSIRIKTQFYSFASAPSGNEEFMKYVINNNYSLNNGFYNIVNIYDGIPNNPIPNITNRSNNLVYSRVLGQVFGFEIPASFNTGPYSYHSLTNSYKFALINYGTLFDKMSKNANSQTTPGIKNFTLIECLPRFLECCVYKCGSILGN